ncbi:MAG: hypothetical protein ACR2K3_14735 [Nocardioides sp.]
MHPDLECDLGIPAPDWANEVEADLDIADLIAAMAQGDQFLHEVARSALFQPLTDPDVIAYRQDVLADCVDHLDTVKRLYGVSTEAVQVERKILLGWNSNKPRTRLHRSRACMVGYVALLRRLRVEADAHTDEFLSCGMRTLFTSIRSELADDYLADVQRCLALLEFRGGLLETARLGMANEGTHYVLRAPERTRPGLWETLTSGWGHHTVTVAERDMAGAESVGELQEHGSAVTAEALGQSADHVKAYFHALRQQLGFYLACVNLRGRLLAAGLPLCRPEIVQEPGIRAHQLFDPLLASPRTFAGRQ